jgi:colicin import membrane protein
MPRIVRPAPIAEPAPPAEHSKYNAQSWGLLFKTQVERCWKRPKGDGRAKIEAIFTIKLKRDGMLEAVRIISPIDTSPYGKAYQSSSFRAIMDCQPYRLPDAYYDEWRHFEPVFTDRYSYSMR